MRLQFIFTDIYINERWTDPALIYDYMNPCKTNISFDDKVLQKLWIPVSPFEKQFFLSLVAAFRYLGIGGLQSALFKFFTDLRKTFCN